LNNTYKTAMEQLRFSEDFEKKATFAMRKAAQKRQKKRYFNILVYAGIGVAACVALALLLPFALNTPESGQSPQITQVAEASVTQTVDSNTPPETRKIVTSSNYSSGLMDSYMAPNAGTVIISNEVMRALNDTVNADSYFFVEIDIIPPEQYINSFDDYIYNGRSVGEWRELIELSNGTYPYSEYNGDHGGNITKEQWEQAQEEARTLDAQANYDAAAKQYKAEIVPMLATAKETHISNELNRLGKLGYDVFLTDTWSYYGAGSKEQYAVFSGLLTKTQLLEFDTDPECGYFIEWVRNGDGIVDWKD